MKKWLLRLFWRCETVLALSLAWLLVFVVPFRRTAALLGRARQSEGPRARTTKAASPTLKRAAAVTRRLARIAETRPFRTTCLVRAVAGWLLLRRRAIPATIRFGVAKENGALTAHAWLIVDGEILLGGEAADGYQPLADLGG